MKTLPAIRKALQAALLSERDATTRTEIGRAIASLERCALHAAHKGATLPKGKKS